MAATGHTMYKPNSECTGETGKIQALPEKGKEITPPPPVLEPVPQPNQSQSSPKAATPT